MGDFVFDKDIIQEIKRVIYLTGKSDLLEYFEYLCETIAKLDISDSDDEVEEEEIEVGQTEDGFYYLK
jgi:hypothetical protein